MIRVKPHLLLCLALLAGCSPGTPTASMPDARADATGTSESSPTATLRPSQTPSSSPAFDLPEAEASPTPHPSETALPLPTTSIQPVQLFFPTLVPAEGAEYRPPLYPVPWALSPHDHFYFSRPISAFYPSEPVADYRYGGIFFTPEIIHTGVDIPAPRGTDVLAAGPGTVVWAGVGLYLGSSYYTDDPYGKAVAIRHDFGYQDQPLFTVYAHMDEIDVIVGQHVNTGDVVGNVGTTGFTTGPHLHFEVRLGENDFWKSRNPELWMAPAQGYGVLVGRVMYTGGTLLSHFLVLVKNLGTEDSVYVRTYAAETINRDSYYQENLVLGDLPAGLYELNIPFGTLNRKVQFEILPGQVTYFRFYGYSGYFFDPPPESPLTVGQP